MITIKKDFRSLRIYINGLLHLDILMESYLGLQSWLEGTNNYIYFIEFYLKGEDAIICEYDDKDIWKEILTLIDKNI